HDLQLRHAGDGPADQLGRQDPLHVRRTDVGADRLPRAQRHRLARRGAAFAMLCQLVRPCAGAQGCGALYRRRPQGAAEISDPRSLRPFDVAAVADSVKKTNRIVSVEEGWPFAGIGSEIAAIVMEECFDWLDAPLKRVAGKDVPLPYAANLERLAVPQVEDIVAAAREVAYR